ncbi:hypothetical protein EV421DRAFT_513792 [Armillaria borealis]|uniref:Uncharacterized protein n=1 Tax=Armillaria borealis TaxID=47425 RepID=A0AA39JNS7_9AGAR|nr:hypothetical protein EV421DRAFT_513792 [Armillaria borealis]
MVHPALVTVYDILGYDPSHPNMPSLSPPSQTMLATRWLQYAPARSHSSEKRRLIIRSTTISAHSLSSKTTLPPLTLSRVLYPSITTTLFGPCSYTGMIQRSFRTLPVIRPREHSDCMLDVEARKSQMQAEMKENFARTIKWFEESQYGFVMGNGRGNLRILVVQSENARREEQSAIDNLFPRLFSGKVSKFHPPSLVQNAV